MFFTKCEQDCGEKTGIFSFFVTAEEIAMQPIVFS